MNSLFCPACDSEYKRRQRIKANTVIWRCKNCSLEFAKFTEGVAVPTDPDLFHGISESFEAQLEIARVKLPKRIAAYEKILGRKIKSVIEVGVATGVYARVFEELGVRYTGIEIDEAMAAVAQERNPGFDIRHIDFMEVGLEDKYDVLFASQVLELSLIHI